MTKAESKKILEAYIEKRRYQKGDAKTYAELDSIMQKISDTHGLGFDAATACPPLNKKGERRIDAKGLKMLDKCMESEPATIDLHKKNGRWTASRKKLHNEIIAHFTAEKPCEVRQPIALFTGGPSGAGKSTILKKLRPYLRSKEVFTIDADDVRAELPEYTGWNAGATHEEASYITKELVKQIGNPCRFDLIIDGTMNKAAKYHDWVKLLRKLGYRVFMVYVKVDKATSRKRVLDRYKSHGRFVPMWVIDEIFSKGLKPMEEVKTLVDGWSMYDGITGKLLGEGGEKLPTDRPWTNTFKQDVPSKRVKK